MLKELSDEDLVILLAGFQTMQAVGTEPMRRILALEARLKEARDGRQEAPEQQGAAEAVKAG